jgi:filamin
MSKEALPPWAEIQKKTFTNWVNVHLSERGFKIENLANDLSDGLKLINLLEQISAKRLPKYTKVVKFHNQKLENVGIALKFLKDEGLKLVAIGPEDVVECRIKLILGLIWTIILRWQIQKISYSEGSPGAEKGGDSKAELLAWVNKVIPKHPVKNLNKDWQDGKSLAALTNYLRPGAVEVNPDDEPLELVTKAVTAAEKIKVPAVISPEDIISPHLDDLSMMTYVSMFREREAQIKLPDPTKFVAYGAGLRAPVARKKNKFTVVSKNSEGTRLQSGGLLINSKFAPKVVELEKYHQAKVKDNRNGEYSIGYIPTSPGEYVIYVTLQEFDIAGSPFTVTVTEPTVISAEHSIVDPIAKELHRQEGAEADPYGPKRFYFHVTTHHNDGSRVTHGGASLVAAIFTDEGELESVIEDKDDGTYQVVFSEPPAGEFTVAVGLAGEDGENVLEHVSGSPFIFAVSPSGHVDVKPAEKKIEIPKEKPKVVVTISPRKSVVQTRLLTKPDGRKFFHVITKDEHGNQAYVPTANIRAKLSPPSKGPYFLISRLNHLVLTIPENKNVPGEFVLTWTKKSGNANQLWYFTADGGVENVKTGLVLDVSKDGTKIVVQNKKATPEQGWAYNPITEILVSNQPAKPGRSEGGLALDIQHAKKQSGASIVVFPKRHHNNNKSQRWYLVSLNKPAQSVPPAAVATFYIVSRLQGFVLGAKANSPGAEVVLVEKKPASDDSHAHQLWKFTPDGFVQNAATGLVLDIKGNQGAGTKTILWNKKPTDNTNQKWKYSPVTELLESDKDGLLLNVEGANKAEGTHAILGHPNKSKIPSQLWYLVPSSKGNSSAVPNISANIPVEIQDHKDGTYDVVFEPEVSGKYDVSVGLAVDDVPTEGGKGEGEEREGEGEAVQHFEHSPFVTEINPATEVSPPDSTVSKIPTVLPNGDRVFQVTLRDKDKHKIPFSGVPIAAHVVAKHPHGKDEPVPVSIVDLGGGIYDVVVKPKGSGPYLVDVGLPKEDDHTGAVAVHIGDAPFEVAIDLASDLDPANSTVDVNPVARLAHAPPIRPRRSWRGKRDPSTQRGSDEPHPSTSEHGKGYPSSDDKYLPLGDLDDSDNEEGYIKESPEEQEKRRKGQKGSPHGTGDKVKPETVRRVWKARAKDVEGNPILHGGAPVAAKASAYDAPLPVAVEDNKDGTYDVVVTVPYDDDLVPVVLDVGISHNLESSPPGQEDIALPFSGTPFTANVDTNDDNVVPEGILELDPVPKFSRKSSTPYFVVHSKDKAGHPLERGGLPVAAQLANLEGVPPELEGVLERLADTNDKEALLLALENAPATPLHIKDKKDGTYRLVLDDPASGDFVLDLGLGDPSSSRPTAVLDRTPELPIVLSIDLGDSDAIGDLDITKSEADLSNLGEDLLHDGSLFFPVLTKDSNGEPLHSGGAPIAAAVSVATRRGEKPVPTKVIDNGDGTYNVAFIPKRLPGVYSIAVGLEDEDGNLNKDNQIKDFPILVQLGPGVPDRSSPLAQAADSFSLFPKLTHNPEDGEGGFGFEVAPNPDKPDVTELLEALGATLAAQIVDDNLNEIPTKIHDKGHGKKRVSFHPKPNEEYSVGVALVDADKNAAEIPDSPFFIAVGPDGTPVPFAVGPDGAPVAHPAGRFAKGLADEPVVVARKGSRPTEAAPVTSPFELKSSPYNATPQRPEYAKTIEAPSPQKTTIDGPGLDKAFPNKVAAFTIHPRSATGTLIPQAVPSLFRAKATSPHGEDVSVKLSPNPDGTITATYTPTAAGPLKIDVAVADPKGDFHSVHGAPHEVTVASGVSAKKSRITGPGITDLDTVITNKERAYFIIETFDSDGIPTGKGGEKFEVKIKPPSLLSSLIALFVHPDIKDNEDGTYTVWYEPRDGGKHTINVTLHSEHVGSSPIEIDVELGTEEEESIAVDYMFTIEARTRGGIPRNRGGDKFAVTINGPEGPVEDVRVDDLSETHPGKYRVFYTLPGKGKYTIKATLNGKDIKGSPWKQKL